MLPDDACEMVGGAGPPGLVLSCEHASVRLPAPWSWSEDDAWLLDRHWSHDIGAATLTRELAAHTGAPAVLARFSRLLIDPNRPLSSPSLIRDTADGRPVHLNRAVGEDDRRRRVAYWEAFHASLSALAAAPGARTIFAVHSFTQSYEGETRDFEIGVLFDEDEELARAFAAELSTIASTRLNEPYSGKQGLIYSAHRHAIEHGLRAVEIEVRQDRILDAALRGGILRAAARVLV